MASTLVRGKYVICQITDSNSAEIITDGAIFQRDGEIIEVGRYDELRTRYKADEIIGSPNQVVMPGLINANFHVGLSPFQRGSPDLPLELWMADRWRGRDVDPYLDNLYGAVQMIRSGVTTNQVLASHTPEAIEKVLKAYQESGMRVSYGRVSPMGEPLVVRVTWLLACVVGRRISCLNSRLTWPSALSH
jgi:cytosine/adenosine deaminase-related metal-dependent hydrolase